MRSSWGHQQMLAAPLDIETGDQLASRSRNSASCAIPFAFVLGMVVATTGLLSVQHYCLGDTSFTDLFFALAVPGVQRVSGSPSRAVGVQVSNNKGHHSDRVSPDSMHQPVLPRGSQQMSISLLDMEDFNSPTMSTDDEGTAKQAFGSPFPSVSPVLLVHSSKAFADMGKPPRADKMDNYKTSNNAAMLVARPQNLPLSLITFSSVAFLLLMIIIGGLSFLQQRGRCGSMDSMGDGGVSKGMMTPSPHTFPLSRASLNIVKMAADGMEGEVDLGMEGEVDLNSDAWRSWCARGFAPTPPTHVPHVPTIHQKLGIHAISPIDALPLLESGRVPFVDVRADWQFAASHLPGSINVPAATPCREELTFNLNDTFEDDIAQRVPLDERLVLICNDGTISSIVASRLLAAGFGRVEIVAGGVRAWKIAEFALESCERTMPPDILGYDFPRIRWDIDDWSWEPKYFRTEWVHDKWCEVEVDESEFMPVKEHIRRWEEAEENENIDENENEKRTRTRAVEGSDDEDSAGTLLGDDAGKLSAVIEEEEAPPIPIDRRTLLQRAQAGELPPSWLVDVSALDFHQLQQEDKLSQLTVKELKSFLFHKQTRVSGTKAHLIKRVEGFLSKE